MPKVSVLLTSYNHGKYLRQAIDSVLAQTFSDFELIVLDDASTDDSWGIINSYSDQRIKAVRNNKNKYAVFLINLAIREICSGCYIAIHHSDDVWHPEKLQKQVEFLDKNLQYGAVFTNALAIDDSGDVLKNKEHFYSNIFDQQNRSRYEWLNHFFYKGNALCHPSVLIRKICYDECGLYRYGLTQLPDYDYWIRLCLRYEIYVMPEKLVRFRVLDNEMNTSANRGDTRIRINLELYQVLINYLAVKSINEFILIFPDSNKYIFDFRYDVNVKFVFAMLLLEGDSLSPSKFLAFDILFKLLNDERCAVQLAELHAFDNLEFIRLSAKYDIFGGEKIAMLTQLSADQESEAAKLKEALEDRNSNLAYLNRVLMEQDNRIAGLELQCSVAKKNVEEILYSTSWKITAPVRAVGDRVRWARDLIRLAQAGYRHCGGVVGAIKKIIVIIRCDGIEGVKKRLRWLAAHSEDRSAMSSHSYITGAPDVWERDSAEMDFVPYYLNENHEITSPNAKRKIGVHLHLYYKDMLDECISYLNNIKVDFDLYVSVSDDSDTISIAQTFRRGIDHVVNVYVECVPNRGRDIAPLIIQFGTRLLDYDFVLHMQTKKSPHSSIFGTWFNEIVGTLLGSPNDNGVQVNEIFDLLSKDAKIIYPEPNNNIVLDRSGWSDNYALAKDLLERYSEYRIEDFPVVEFPQGSMFWARSDAVRTLLSLPLTYEDFPVEPLPSDGTIAHVLERLILVFASNVPGRCYRLHSRDSIPDFRGYEGQIDFSNSVSSSSIRVLSYYLPQFHPIAENDEWHGKGFTEWTKVRAANPLFRGHYQQHIPHPDIGYYLLDTPEKLRKQTDLMRKSGVYGQVFYHYWFTGKLILDEPARMLLANPDIAMPFCFCWANENWTRRWDGNENEILLGQNYSADDARQFIRYLIPFFQDIRYIRLDDRPVLFVYRPSSIPDIQQYLDIWAEECLANGLKAPYMVAVLTRGATHPAEFGMDAGVERVLHDWTAGGAPEIKGELEPYAPINGSVLAYDDVADFYTAQKTHKDFTYFRSLVPIWDNTARYGSEAFVVHGSTPERFQKWLESTIQFTKQTLPLDRQFVVINAWNEWAEGAHLEPDTRFGYAYLNSVGRALSGIPYAGRMGGGTTIPAGTCLHFNFPPHIRQALAGDHELARRFFHTLARSSVFHTCDVTVSDGEYLRFMPRARVGGEGDAAYRLDFRRISFFSPQAIERMLQAAFQYPESIVISNTYDGDKLLADVTKNGSVHAYHAHDAALVMLPRVVPVGGFKNFRIRTDAQCFVAYPNATPEVSLPIVTTIIRFHKSGDLELLRNALCCLAAMHECLVRPLIAAQDLAELQVSALNQLLDDFSWPARATPVVHQYFSPEGCGDLRSKMLNESLRRVDTQYAAFLDYDDLMMSHAYAWLVGRLRKTGKAVAFGRVYGTAYDCANGYFIERIKEYEYGNSYEEFVNLNHAPLHSFLMDVSKLDIKNIFFHEDQRYMEDYFLTLQLFRRDNCDWDGLVQNVYIGDYIHSIDRAHTLAFSSDSRDADRQALLESPEYLLCEQRIIDLRRALS